MKRLYCVLLVILVGCAPQTRRVQVDSVAQEIEAKKQSEMAVRSSVDDAKRVYNIAYLIATKAQTLCGDSTTYTIGILFANADQFKTLKEAAAAVYGLSDVVKVMHVAPGSVGESSGVKVGDIPTTVNDWQVPIGENATKAIYEKLEKMKEEGKPVVFNLLRGDEKRQITIYPAKACASRVGIQDSDIVNAFADGKNVVITRGMLRFTKDDTELALVISHEFSHNAMGHLDKKWTNSLLGAILDGVITGLTGVRSQIFQNMGAAAFSQDFEAEADYVGLYMMAYAGMDIEHAPEFWRRMAAAHPSSIRTNMSASHPATAYRMLALEQTVQEIDKKRASNAPLVPEMKDKKSDTMQAKVEQPTPTPGTKPDKVEPTTPVPSASSAALARKAASVAAQEQPSQEKSLAAKNENAAPSGSSNVQLAMSFQDGVNAYGQKDYTKALSIFRGLADQGDARAQTNLGLMHQQGLGVTKDDAEAVKWYRKAADQNFVTAQFNLGCMYSNGRGVAKNDVEAVNWYRKAADRGNAPAQFNLGRKYEQGEGVVKDQGEAVKWFHKAADQGYAPAQETLRRLGAQ